MADILYVLTLAFLLIPLVNASDTCHTYSYLHWRGSYEYCTYGCCSDTYHSGYYKCCDSDSIRKALSIGPIIGIVVGCLTLVGAVISVVCCVCSMQQSHRTHGQTVSPAANGPYVTNQMPYGSQMGQAPNGQQSYPAQPPIQTGHMAPGTTVVNN